MEAKLVSRNKHTHTPEPAPAHTHTTTMKKDYFLYDLCIHVKPLGRSNYSKKRVIRYLNWNSCWNVCELWISRPIDTAFTSRINIECRLWLCSSWFFSSEPIFTVVYLRGDLFRLLLLFWLHDVKIKAISEYNADNAFYLGVMLWQVFFFLSERWHFLPFSQRKPEILFPL